MSGLRYHDENGKAFCKTPFGTYVAGHSIFPIYSDIGSRHGESSSLITVFWSRLDEQLLYAGFNVYDAFTAMEHDFQSKKAGSLQYFLEAA